MIGLLLPYKSPLEEYITNEQKSVEELIDQVCEESGLDAGETFKNEEKRQRVELAKTYEHAVLFDDEDESDEDQDDGDDIGDDERMEG